MLRLSLASALSLAALPSIAAAQQDAASAPDSAISVDMTAPDRRAVWAVTTGEASLRAQPDIANNRFGFARAGTPLQILDSSDGWSYVYNPHTQGAAYVSSSLLQASDPPSRYVFMPAPPVIEPIEDTIVVTQDSVLTNYPTRDPDATFAPLQASATESVVGKVRGDDGTTWYQTADSYYVPPDGVFVPSESGSYTGRWLLATLLPITKVVALEGQTPLRTMLALRGIAVFPTPTGVFSILRRVPNETMDSMTLGIPHNSPYGYLVKNVLYTQYFTPDGASLHDNWWSSNFGGIGSHGCLGMSLSDSKWLWDWASIGVPVVVNKS